MNLPVDYSKIPISERRAVREEYIKLQRGKCYHCSGNLEEPPPKAVTYLPIDWDLFPHKFMDNPVHLHHNHDTDKTIGAVHAYCNAVLFQYLGE